jgi:hypothetical protein
MDNVVSQVFQVSDALGGGDNPPLLCAIHHVQKGSPIFKLNGIDASEHLVQDDIEHTRIPARQVFEGVEFILRIVFFHTDLRALCVGTFQPLN